MSNGSSPNTDSVRLAKGLTGPVVLLMLMSALVMETTERRSRFREFLRKLLLMGRTARRANCRMPCVRGSQ